MLIESAAGAAPCSLPLILPLATASSSPLPIKQPGSLPPSTCPYHGQASRPSGMPLLATSSPTPHTSNTDPQPGILGLMPISRDQQQSPPGVPRTHEKPLLPPSSSASALQGRAGSSRERRQALEGGRVQAAQLVAGQPQRPASRWAVRGRVLWRALPGDDGVWCRC